MNIEKRKELFEKLRDVGFKVQNLKGIVQNECPVYPQGEIDEWEFIMEECIQELIHLKEEILLNLNKEVEK